MKKACFSPLFCPFFRHFSTRFFAIFLPLFDMIFQHFFRHFSTHFFVIFRGIFVHHFSSFLQIADDETGADEIADDDGNGMLMTTNKPARFDRLAPFVYPSASPWPLVPDLEECRLSLPWSVRMPSGMSSIASIGSSYSYPLDDADRLPWY